MFKKNPLRRPLGKPAASRAPTEESPLPEIRDPVEASKTGDPLITKLHKVRDTLNSLVFERHDATDGILISVLSGCNTLFLGEVGTAKTYHLQAASALLGLSNFDILMSETIRPDQIFGPTDIPALAQGRQQTKYIGYAPDCEILFFDEIFKANATVLNPLLWLINEHRFRDGDNGVIKCAVKATFAASNELPTDPLLKALYDRFILRFKIDYLKDESNVRKLVASFLVTPDEVEENILSSQEVEELRTRCRAVAFPDKCRDAAMRIRRKVELTMQYSISDRRFLKSLRAIQAAALLAGRDTVEIVDLEVLAHVFWDGLEHIKQVQSIVYASSSGDTAAVTTYLERAHALKAMLVSGGNLRQRYLEVVTLYQHCSKFQSRFAQQAAAEIKVIASSYRHYLKARSRLSVVEVFVGDHKLFKVSPSSSIYWTTKELRTMGFKNRRKGNYWWTDRLGPIRTKLEAVGIVVTIAKLE